MHFERSGTSLVVVNGVQRSTVLYCSSVQYSTVQYSKKIFYARSTGKMSHSGPLTPGTSQALFRPTNTRRHNTSWPPTTQPLPLQSSFKRPFLTRPSQRSKGIPRRPPQSPRRKRRLSLHHPRRRPLWPFRHGTLPSRLRTRCTRHSLCTSSQSRTGIHSTR